MTDKLEDYGLGKSLKSEGTIQRIGIVGCCISRQDIIIHLSKSGLEVAFVDLYTNVEAVIKNIEEELDNRIKRWGLTDSEKRLILSRIYGSPTLEALANCDIIIETLVSKTKQSSIDLRRDIFCKIEAIAPEKTVIVSNTSSLMISDISSALKHPDRAMGLYFINPIEKVKIIESVRTVYTSDECYNTISKFALMIGKKLITVNESAGNISTRMIVPFINEACEILMEGVAAVSDIDETLRQSSGMQLGPFEMADKIGLDVILRWMENLYIEFGQLKYKPSPVIKRLVRANMLGRKTGEGFYYYKNGKTILKMGPISNLGR